MGRSISLTGVQASHISNCEDYFFPLSCPIRIPPIRYQCETSQSLQSERTSRTLTGANFKEADLTGTDFRGAILSLANFNGAILILANLSGANFPGFANPEMLINANLSNANLTHAIFTGLNLQGTILNNADLSSADLRRTQHCEFDQTCLRGAQLSPYCSDRWSELRRKYTGTRFFLTLLFLIAYFFPLAAQLLFWNAVGRVQATHYFDAERNTDRLTQMTVFEKLISLEQGWLYAILAILLVMYNVGRGLLTWRIGPMRDEEDRSGYTPEAAAFQQLYWVDHRILRWLVYASWVSAVLLIFTIYSGLGTTVWVPKP